MTTENPVTGEYRVSGMTCEHCVGAVTAELKELSGVGDVTVRLVPSGTSVVTVTSTTPLEREDVAAAVDEAGYALVDDRDLPLV